jgi:hypothetical protein
MQMVAVRKNLDLVWVWFYKDVAPMVPIIKMKFHELEMRVLRALSILYDQDQKLFSLKVSEWALAHRLALYLESEMEGWNVDCEYNRQGNDDSGGKPNPNEHEEKKNVRPDIVIHHRSELTPEHNLLVIELKMKLENANGEKTRAYTTKPSPDDRRKYQYQFGLALSLLQKPILYWYEDGKPKLSEGQIEQ